MLNEAWHVFSDPPHVIAEAASTLVELIIISPVLALVNNWWHKRHDKRKHGE